MLSLPATRRLRNGHERRNRSRPRPAPRAHLHLPRRPRRRALCPACRGAGHRWRRAGDLELRQRRHRSGGQGGGGDDRAQLRARSPGQGRHQHRLGPAGAGEPGLPHAALRAAPAGVRGGGERWRDQDRARGGCQAACLAGNAWAGHLRRRSAGDRGLRAQERVGGATGQRAATADHAQQQHRRGPDRQCAGHHRLRRQPAAHRPHHRLARCASRGRAHHRALAQRVGGRHGAGPQSPAR